LFSVSESNKDTREFFGYFPKLFRLDLNVNSVDLFFEFSNYLWSGSLKSSLSIILSKASCLISLMLGKIYNPKDYWRLCGLKNLLVLLSVFFNGLYLSKWFVNSKIFLESVNKILFISFCKSLKTYFKRRFSARAFFSRDFLLCSF